MDVVSRDIAEKEVNDWLDKKKVMPSTREANESYVKTLVDAIAAGVLTLDSTGKDGKEPSWKFTHKLLFPFGDEVKVDQLEYFPRLNDKMLKPYMNGIKPDDADGRLNGYAAALTRQNRAILELMDTADKKITMAITIFFL